MRLRDSVVETAIVLLMALMVGLIYAARNW
jgi:hypothetical protein